MDAPLTGLSPAVPEVPKPVAEAAKTEEPKIVDGKPVAPVANQPVVPEKLWAGQFKRPEDMEVAHLQSSKEGRRLAGELKARETALEAANAQVKELTDKLNMGPELKELTDADMQNMTPQQIALHVTKQAEQQRLKASLAEKSVAQAKATKQEQEARSTAIMERSRAMENDKERYPDYNELVPVMEDILDFEPMLSGHPGSPLVLYYAAKGYRAAQGAAEAAKASATSEEKAKVKAAADASAAGGTGPTSSAAVPAGSERNVDPDSDEAHNAALLRGGRRASVFG